jgi:hypothetical protein
MRSNQNITYNGKTKTTKQWARHYNINYGTLRSRIKLGWPIKEALTYNIGEKYHDKYTKLELFGMKKSIMEWAELSPVTPNAFIRRLKIGWILEQSLIFPPFPNGKTYKSYLKNVTASIRKDDDVDKT